MVRMLRQFGARAPGLLAFLFGCTAFVSAAHAVDNWTVTIRLQQADSLTDDDASVADDIYWDVTMVSTIGTAAQTDCSTKENHEDDNNHIKPNWASTINVTGGANTTVQIDFRLLQHDSTSGDDTFDINPDPGRDNLLMTFTPSDGKLSIAGVPGRDTPQCVPGGIRLRGVDGDDRAEVVYTVTSSLVGAPDGDSDTDGLPDNWELCGVDGDGDGTAEINLQAMGANPFRKDIFVETDWLTDAANPTVASRHSHTPWLPSLIDAWNELNQARVTNPTHHGNAEPNGIALHVDTGTLYSNYNLDFNGDGTNEITVGADGNFDVDGDGLTDIGDLGALAGGPTGGNGILEVGGTSLLGSSAPTPPVSENSFFDAGSTFAQLKAANFDAARETSFRYFLFAHNYQSSLLAGVTTDGSSGLTDPCTTVGTIRLPCNNIIVSLGGWTQQNEDRTDTAGNPGPDGIPDIVTPGAPLPVVLNGPEGVPVDGTMRQHTGTFLHELGHSMGLTHGGSGAFNFKPNYLSIMNYSWQTRGIGFNTVGPLNTADPVGVDFDRDSFQDLSRFIYSGLLLNPPKNALNEVSLDEGTAPDSDTGLISYTCPAPAIPPPPAPVPAVPSRVVNGNQPVDWNCSGGNSPAGTTIPPTDINNVNRTSNSTTDQLPGFDDFGVIQSAQLNGNHTGIELEQERQLRASQLRFTELSREFPIEQFCRSTKVLDFEGWPSLTRLTTEYHPYAEFPLAADRDEVTFGPAERNNRPTRSGDFSLASMGNDRQPASLIVNFPTPVRTFAVFYGQAGLTSSPREQVEAVFAAFDQDGLPMGEIRKPLPPPSVGIRQYFAAITVWPDEVISRLELRYEFRNATTSYPIPEPVEIDDLTVCAQPDQTTTNPLPPPAVISSYGDTQIRLSITSLNLVTLPAPAGDPLHNGNMSISFIGLPVKVGTMTTITNGSVVAAEGSVLTLTAPKTFAGGEFRYWQHSSGASFGTGQNTIPLTLLANGTITAVYANADVGRPPG